MKKYHVYGIGNALVDKEFEVSDDFLASMKIDKGVMTLIDEDTHIQYLSALQEHCGLKKRSSGGSAANTIAAISQFGGNSYYDCRVADDETGHFYISDMEDAGVSLKGKPSTEPGQTGKCLVMVTPDAERTMQTFLGITADFSEHDLTHDALLESEYVYVEGYLVSSENALAAAVQTKQKAKEHGIKVACTLSDPAMVQFFRPGVETLLDGGVDLLFCNETEALQWANTDQLDDAISVLKNTAKQFAITLGSQGAMLFDGEELIKIPPCKVNAVDTNGAGDMFAGAFLFAITHGRSFEDAGHLACLAASKVVTQFGARLEAQQHQAILEEADKAQLDISLS